MTGVQNSKVYARFVSVQKDFNCASNPRGSSKRARNNIPRPPRKNANRWTDMRECANHLDCSSISAEREYSVVFGTMRAR